MATVMEQAGEAERLVSLIDSDDPYGEGYAALIDRQLAAIDAQFQDRVGRIKLLANRAEEGGVSAVRSLHDLVPLLFAHTAYKSYPESWLMDGRWDRMGKWLDTVSTRRVPPLDTGAVKGLDDWLARLDEVGHFVSCSSGTTGKCAMMNATQADLDFCGKALLRMIEWQGLAPNHDRRMISMGQVAASPRNRATGLPMVMAFSPPDFPPFAPDVPPITIGGIVDMVVLRKRIAEGTAQPSELEHYEAETARREAAMASAVEQATEALIANRGHKLHIMGMFGPLYHAAKAVRERGYSGKDFQENSTFVSGGLKRVAVPDNYKAFIFETFNISQDRALQSYGMQELNSNAPRCAAGRYHVPPWMVLLLLDESGERLIEPCFDGEVEGRAAFYDMSMEGRWGGVISGDKIRATWGRCECGRASPSIADDIQRYADLASGDKIACSGTIDAYVRGVT
jgi:hypothetical protein